MAAILKQEIGRALARDFRIVSARERLRSRPTGERSVATKLKSAMSDRPTSVTCWIGLISAIAVFVLGLAYGITLGLGFLSLRSAGQPIGDPWFSILELLIIPMMPAMVTLMAAVHAWTPVKFKALSLSSLTFMSMAGVLTTSVHFTVLVLGRTELFAGQAWAPLMLSFEWPSLPYVLDILAWDLFFALSMIIAAPIFGGSRLELAIRILLLVGGLLSLAGLTGLAAGNMDLRNIAILGYAGVFPVVCALLAMLFHYERTAERQFVQYRPDARP